MSDKPESAALALRQPIFSLVPGSLGEAMEMAKLITSTELCPKSYRGKPNEAIVAYDYGRNLGLSWMQSLRFVAVINGNPALWGDAVPAVIHGSNACERLHEYFEGKPYEDAYTAVCVMKRKGLPDEVKRTFSVADAKQAHLWGKRGREGQETPWITYPARMLQMRARGFAARDCFADKLAGLILAEEAMDYPDAIDATVVSSETVASPLDRLPEGLRDNIEKAFATLNLAPGLRVAKINEFLGAEVVPEEGAERLLVWCRDEFARRKTGQPVKRDTDNGKKSKAASASAPVSAPAAPADAPPPDPLGAAAGSAADTRHSESPKEADAVLF